MNMFVERKSWNSIYNDPQEYDYYDLYSPYPGIDDISATFKKYGVQTILDVGCGLGGNLLFMTKEGFNLTGIDASSQAIDQLQIIAKANNLFIPLVVGNFQNLPFSNASFDAVMCIQTLQHGYERDVQQGIAEIYRVLRNQGLLFLTVPGRTTHHKLRYSLVKTANRVADRVYIPTQGKEIGIPHYIFNKSVIRQHLKDFTTFSDWKDIKDYYCIFAKKK